MNILMLSANDPAGMGIAFKNAINGYSDHCCRLITTEEKYGFGYEKDIHFPDCTSEKIDIIENLLIDADIIHFHILADEHMHFGPLLVKDYIKGKEIVHHHHGHPHFRANPNHYEKKYRQKKRKMLVSTPDLLQLAPSAIWVPNLVPLDDPLLKPITTNRDKKIVIGQSPTRKELKNTKELVTVVADLQRQYPDKKVKLKLFELLPHQKCLAKKRKCQIIFDHMQGYFGVSSLESLSQGKPVIAGLDEWNKTHIKEFAGTDKLPWSIARNKEELIDVLRDLIEDTEKRLLIGRNSREFVEKHWYEQKIVGHLLRCYNA